jgi:hypothetical protein
VLHLKGAVVDGVAWLDDRNWDGARAETIIRDSEADDVAALRAALAGRPGSDARLETTKAGAQALELAVVRGAGAAPLALATESFGSGAVYDALLARAKAHGVTRLLVAGREAREAGKAGEAERRRLGRLADLGIEVRTGNPPGADADEKLALAGTAAWVGSANASYARGPYGRQRDWGLLCDRTSLIDGLPSVIDGLRAVFEANWRAGRELNAGSNDPKSGGALGGVGPSF